MIDLTSGRGASAQRECTKCSRRSTPPSRSDSTCTACLGEHLWAEWTPWPILIADTAEVSPVGPPSPGICAGGLSAAKIAARSRRSGRVVDAGQPRNAPAAGVHNYLYAEGAPADLRATGRAEVVNYGVAIHDGAALAARVL